MYWQNILNSLPQPSPRIPLGTTRADGLRTPRVDRLVSACCAKARDKWPPERIFAASMSELLPPFQRGILSMYKISLFLTLVGVKAVETFPERSLPLSATQKKPQDITQDFKCFFQMWWGESLAYEQRQWQDNFQRWSSQSKQFISHTALFTSPPAWPSPSEPFLDSRRKWSQSDGKKRRNM